MLGLLVWTLRVCVQLSGGLGFAVTSFYIASPAIAVHVATVLIVFRIASVLQPSSTPFRAARSRSELGATFVPRKQVRK